MLLGVNKGRQISAFPVHTQSSGGGGVAVSLTVSGCFVAVMKDAYKHCQNILILTKVIKIRQFREPNTLIFWKHICWVHFWQLNHHIKPNDCEKKDHAGVITSM